MGLKKKKKKPEALTDGAMKHQRQGDKGTRQKQQGSLLNIVDVKKITHAVYIL